MAKDDLHPTAARRELYDVFRGGGALEGRAEAALELGRRYLDADAAHLARVDIATDHWEVLVSTDPEDGRYPAGTELDLSTTYCRRTIAAEGSTVVHDAAAQGWRDDPAFEASGLSCYHGTAVVVDGEPYGTVCFVAEDARGPFSDDETMYAELVAALIERDLERDRVAAALGRQTNLAQVLNRVLRHNLRNRMTVIRGLTQEMADRLDDDALERPVLEEIDRLLELTRKARELDQIVGGPERRHRVDIVALVADVVASVSADHPRASIEFEGPDGSIHTAVLPSLERAIEELVVNAAKHAGTAPEVTVGVDLVPNAVAIRVADDGPGLSDQERAVLKTGVETPLLHGSGLGLWLVHWIVSSHGGSIETAVTPEGTTMTVTVPRTEETGEGAELVELRRARDQYHAAFEEAFDGMIIADDDGRIVDANPRVASVLGVDRDTLLGRPLASLLPPAFDFASLWDELRRSGRVRDTVEIDGAEGGPQLVEYSASNDIVPGQHLLILRRITARADLEGPGMERS